MDQLESRGSADKTDDVTQHQQGRVEADGHDLAQVLGQAISSCRFHACSGGFASAEELFYTGIGIWSALGAGEFCISFLDVPGSARST